MLRLLAVLFLVLFAPQVCWGAASRSYDGNGDYVSFGTPSVLQNVTPPMSACSWAKLASSTNGNNDAILSAGGNVGNTVFGWHLANVPDAGGSRLSMYMDYSTTDPDIKSVSGFISTGTWFWGCGTINSSLVGKVYINGAEPGSYDQQTTGSGSKVSDAGLSKRSGGKENNTNMWWDGQLSNSVIWSEEISNVEMIEAMYKPEFSPEGRIGMWPLFGDTNDVDLSGNGSTGTATNATTSADGPPVMFGGGLPL